MKQWVWLERINYYCSTSSSIRLNLFKRTTELLALGNWTFAFGRNVFNGSHFFSLGYYALLYIEIIIDASVDFLDSIVETKDDVDCMIVCGSDIFLLLHLFGCCCCCCRNHFPAFALSSTIIRQWSKHSDRNSWLKFDCLQFSQPICTVCAFDGNSIKIKITMKCLTEICMFSLYNLRFWNVNI